MSYRDADLLAAITTGNHQKFNHHCLALRYYAGSLGLSLFSDFTIRLDAIDSAMNKATDWLGTEMATQVDYPWKYVRRIISNSLLDSARSRKIESLSLDSKIRDGMTVEEAIAWYDDGFARLVDKNDRDEAAGTGWRLFQVIDEGGGSEDDDGRYHRHKWIKGLEDLSKYQIWWNVGKWVDKFEGEYMTTCQTWRDKDIPIKAKVEVIHSEERLRSKYDLISALIDSIRGESEKKVVLRFLWGNKPVKIAKELKVSEPYISKVLSKWISYWGWGEESKYEARLILLARCLASRYDQTLYGVNKDRMSHSSPEITDLLNEYLALNKAPRKGYRDNVYEKQEALANQIRLEYLKLAIRPKLDLDGVYKKVKSAAPTRVYFHDLDSFEQGDLINLCRWFWGIWYPNRQTFDGWWSIYWSQYDRSYFDYYDA
jgi:hypothetical protein